VSVDRLRGIVAELDALRARLEAPGVEPAEATELLDRISGLAAEAAADLERRAELAEGDAAP